MLAYTDNLNLIWHTTVSIKENFLALEIAATRIGLDINSKKTKFIATDGRNRGNSNLIG